MPDLMEQMYCSQQINIPPNLPFILKQYAKAAIRTQPYDLLYWSAAYFRAKANNSPPPVKERLEYPVVDTPSRLSPGFLKVLHKQLGENDEVAIDVLYEKWLGVCLVKEALDNMLKLGEIRFKVPWMKFVAIAAGYLCASLSKTMVLLCEVLTEEPDGGSAMVPLEVFVQLYQYLARMDCGPVNPHKVLPTPSVVSEAESNSSVETVKKCLLDVPRELGDVEEKDSMAGLMVWPDVQPEEKKDEVHSPHYTEELGASSELGIEVLDEAKGPVVEVVTLYPVQDSKESQGDIDFKKSSTVKLQASEIGDKTILSHSSLKENENWIKIEPRQWFENGEDSKDSVKADTEEEIEEPNTEDIGDVSETGEKDLTTEDSGHGSVDQSEKPSSKIETTSEEEGAAKQEVEADISELHSEEEIVSDKNIADETVIVSVDNVDVQPSVFTGTQGESAVTSEEQQHSGLQSTVGSSAMKTQSTSGMGSDIKPTFSVEIKEASPSEDSVVGPHDAITVQKFVREDLNGSTITYSTGEIRKGLFGEKSTDQVDRLSSENTVREAQTVHQIRSVEEESSTLLPVAKSDKSSSVSSSFVVLEEYWEHVPGIGPVIPEPQILAVVEYMHYWAAKQQGMVMPRNINHILCPPLDLPSTDNALTDPSSRY